MLEKDVLMIAPRNPMGEGSNLPPLGLATIAAHIPQDYNITLVDEGIESVDYSSKNPCLVMISANTLTAKRSYDLFQQFVVRGIPVVLGGIHPSVLPDEASRYATSVVIGEGEGAIKDVISDFENNKLKKRYEPGNFNLEEARVPRRERFTGNYPFYSLETSRGCPYNCEFCTVTEFHGSKYRYKPLEKVEQDLASIVKKMNLLTDDSFLGSGKRAEERAIQLTDVFKNHGINWIGQTSLDIADNPEILRRARESGALAFYIGFESLNEDFLSESSKTINLKSGVKSYKEIIKKIHDHGILILGSFIYGTDYDTRDTLFRLRDFAHESGIDTFLAKPLTPLPGTRLYNRFREQGRLLNQEFWLEDPYPLFTFKPRHLSFKDMEEATEMFVEENKFSKSLVRLVRSLFSTRNIMGSLLSFGTNYTNYRKYKKVSRGLKKQKVA